MPRTPAPSRPGTTKTVSTVKAAQKAINEGKKVRLETVKVEVLRAACAKQRTDEEWQRSVATGYRLAERDLGEEHATTVGLSFQLAQTVYKMHFFGREGYREMLIDSISMHDGAHIKSKRVLGDNHPLTRKIAAAFLKCFDEQLDWSLDDIPDELLEYRALLLDSSGGCAP